MTTIENASGKKTIRVLHLITIFSLGGATENTILSVEGLHGMGYDVRIATGPNISSEGSLFERAQRSDIPVEVIPQLARSIHPWFDLVAFWKILLLLRRGNYHIVHTHSSKAGFLGRVAAKLMGVPIVIHTIHGLPFHDYQGKFIHKIFVLAERVGAKLSDKIITVTDTIAQKALAERVGRPGQYVTVRSGFEMEQFLQHTTNGRVLRKELGLKPGDLVVGKIARFSMLKGHQFVLDVVPDVVRRAPRAKFLFVGSGELEERFKMLVRSSGLEEHVIFAGLVSQDQIAAFMSTMNVVVHTSLLEGLARVLPQALASGIPVVAFDIDGAHEVVKEGISGHLVPAGNRQLLADAIVDLLKNRRKSKALGHNGTSLVKDGWTQEAMVKGINRVYTDLLSDRHILTNTGYRRNSRV